MASYLGNNEVNVFSGNTTIPSGYIRPSGTYNINSNGEYDITNYANVEVDVAAMIEPTIESLTITPTETQQIFNGIFGILSTWNILFNVYILIIS